MELGFDGVVARNDGDKLNREDMLNYDFCEGRDDGDDDFRSNVKKGNLLHRPSFLQADPTSSISDINVASTSSASRKGYSLPRGLTLRSVVKGMKKKSKLDSLSEMKLSEDAEPSKQHLRKVFDRVSQGTNRVLTSIGKTFSSTKVDDSQRTVIGRLFGRSPKSKNKKEAAAEACLGDESADENQPIGESIDSTISVNEA